MQQRRYSEAFKRTVIEAIDQEGLGWEEACRRYDIRKSVTVARWYQTYGRNRKVSQTLWIAMADERSELTRLKEENKQLREALVQKELEILRYRAEKAYLAGETPRSIKKKGHTPSSR